MVVLANKPYLFPVRVFRAWRPPATVAFLAPPQGAIADAAEPVKPAEHRAHAVARGGIAIRPIQFIIGTSGTQNSTMGTDTHHYP